MKTLIVFDSKYGNTQKIAEIVGKTLSCQVVSIEKFKPEILESLELLVMGTPTHGGRPTQAISDLITQIDCHLYPQLKVACFDTRIPVSTVKQKWLQLVIKVIGYASPKMDKQLRGSGVTVVGKPVGFLVDDKEGPLLKGETQKAKEWAQSLL